MLEPIPIPRTLGDHETVRLLGQGAMGYVFEVRSRTTGASYAAKVMKPGATNARDRLRREAELLARCDRHPGIVRVHSVGETPEGAVFIILDLVEGEGLDRILEREGKMAPARAAALGRDIARALGHAHARGIVHRDVKPSNILIDATGPRVTDFGIATACDLERLTRTGVVVGTPRYMAPEQARGADRIGPKADVFALGCVLFEILTGSAALGETGSLVEIMHELDSPRPLRDARALEPSCPASLAAIVARALEKDPARRYANAEEVALDLERHLAGGSVSAVGRRRAVALAAGAGALALGALLASLASGGEVSRRRALAEAKESLARARSLVSAAEAGGDARGAAAEACRAYARALALRDGELERGSASQLVRAMGLLEKDPTATLEVLEGFPSPASLPPEVRLIRVRALVATKRPPSLEEVAAVVSLLPAGPRRAEALELEGDLAFARGESAAAEAAYSAALEASPRAELRTKRGSAAALAGDDATALADLAVIVPDLSRLDRDRKANARLASFAGALYRRALAPGRDADLEAAWRIAPPPPALAAGVAERWMALAAPLAVAWRSDALTDQTEGKMLTARKPLALFARAREADPACDSDAIWSLFEGIWFWTHSWASEKIIESVGRALMEVLPEEPFLLFLVAHPLSGSMSRLDEAIRLCDRAIDHVRPLRAGAHPMAQETPFMLGELLGDLEVHAGSEPDVARFLRIAKATGVESDSWYFLGHYHHMRRAARPCLDALDHVPTDVANAPVGRQEASFRTRGIALMWLLRLDDATAQIMSAPAQFRGRLRDDMKEQCVVWEDRLRSEPEAEGARAGGLAAGKAYVFLEDAAGAERILAALRALDDAGAGELAPLIERARSKR